MGTIGIALIGMLSSLLVLLNTNSDINSSGQKTSKGTAVKEAGIENKAIEDSFSEIISNEKEKNKDYVTPSNTLMYNENYKNKLISNNKPIPVYEAKFEQETNNNSVKKIGGIEKIVLTPQELENIGIAYNDNEIIVPFEGLVDTTRILSDAWKDVKDDLSKYDYLRYENPVLMKITTKINLNSIISDVEKYTGWSHSNWSTTVPVAITSISHGSSLMDVMKNVKFFGPSHGQIGTEDNDTKVTMSYDYYSNFSPLLDLKKMSESEYYINLQNGKYFSTIDKLLPVHIEIGNRNIPDSNTAKYTEIDIWFSINRKFAEKLPARYREPLLNELDLIDCVKDGYISPDSACVALKGEKSYFDLCHIGGNNINNVKLYPNPLTEDKDINLSFNLVKPSKVNVTLYDLSGKYIKSVLHGVRCNPGSNQLSIPGAEMQKGFYMLMLSDEAGEQVIQKLIINK